MTCRVISTCSKVFRVSLAGLGYIHSPNNAIYIVMTVMYMKINIDKMPI